VVHRRQWYRDLTAQSLLDNLCLMWQGCPRFSWLSTSSPMEINHAIQTQKYLMHAKQRVSNQLGNAVVGTGRSLRHRISQHYLPHQPLLARRRSALFNCSEEYDPLTVLQKRDRPRIRCQEPRSSHSKDSCQRCTSGKRVGGSVEQEHVAVKINNEVVQFETKDAATEQDGDRALPEGRWLHNDCYQASWWIYFA